MKRILLYLISLISGLVVYLNKIITDIYRFCSIFLDSNLKLSNTPLQKTRRLATLVFVIACLFFANTVQGQITQVGTAESATTNNTTLTITKPTGLAIGDVMIANIEQIDNENNGGNDLSNATSSGWSIIDGRQLGVIGGNPDYEFHGTLLYKIATGTDVAAPNFSFSLDNDANGDGSLGAIVAFRGVDVTGGYDAGGNANSGPFDVDPGNINTSYSSTITATATTTSTTDAAIIMFGMIGDNQSISNWQISSGSLTLTELYDVSYNTSGPTDGDIGAAWAIKSTAGTTGNGTATFSGNDYNGGILISLRAQPTATLTTGVVSGSPFCVGTTVSIPYSITGTFNAGNIFTAQLSNSSGSFASPVDIGTLTSTASGTISGTIPISTPSGSSYRIRVISNNPSVIGADNGTDLTIDEQPTTATTGSEQDICGTLISNALGGNTPAIGTGAWSIVSGGTGTFSAGSSGSSTFTADAYATYVLRWTISNGTCTESTADITVNYYDNPTTATTGTDQDICGTLLSNTLGGNTPAIGTGAWSIVSGGTGTFSAASSGSSTFTADAYATYVLRWTISNGTCTESTADITVNYYDNPTTATTGTDQDICGTLLSNTLGGNTPAIGTGAWSIVSGGTGTFSAASSGSSTFTADAYATYVLRWTISNGTCTESTADITVNYYDNPTTATTGTDQDICGTLLSNTLGGNTPAIGIGAWSIVSGGTGTFSAASSGSSTFTADAYVTYVLRWTISNGTCTESTADITVNYYDNPTTATTGTDQDICGTLLSGALGGNTPAIGTGAWSIVSGGTGTFSAGSSGSSTFTADAYATYVLRWTISNGTCTASTADITVNYYATPTTATTGSDQDICGTLLSNALGGNTPAIGTGAWSIVSGGTGTFSAGSSGSSTFTADAYATYVLRWTISNGTCTASTADITVNYYATPTTATTGSDQDICGTLLSNALGGNTPAIGTGAWSIVSGGTGTFSAGSSGSSTFTADAYATYVLRWTISNGTCIESTADITVNYYDTPTTAVAGSDQSNCENGNFTLAGNSPTTGTGSWSVVSGTATITTSSSPTSTVTGIPNGTSATLRWTISNNSCTPSTSDVVLYNNQSPTATAGGTQSICQNGTAYIVGATATNGTILWTHDGTGFLTDETTLTPSYTTGIGDAGNTITLTMTVSNAPCLPATATFTVIVDISGLDVPIDIGPAISPICMGGTSTNLGAIVDPSALSIEWTSSVGGTFSSLSDPDATWTPPPAFSGTATLTLAATNSCGTNRESKDVEVHSYTVDIGSAMSGICQGETSDALGASLGGGAANGLWTSDSGGTFTPSATDLNATWTPPAGFFGIATLTLTTTDALCTTASDSKTITVYELPSITTQPTDILDCYEHIVTFNVVTGGTGPYTYTWQRKKPADSDFTDIPVDANISYPSDGTIRIASAGANNDIDGTEYRVVIVNSANTACSLTSDPATLFVNRITDIIPSDSNPLITSVIICDGSNFSYQATTNYPANEISYQWKKFVSVGIWNDVVDGGAISGATTDLLTFTGATSAESGSYRVTIVFNSSGANCNLNSDNFNRELTVLPPIQASTVSSDQTICENTAPAQLTATAASGGSDTSYSYQWQSSLDNSIWTDIVGETSLNYQPLALTSSTYYRIIATDTGAYSCGSATSASILITVNPTPTIDPISDLTYCFNEGTSTIVFTGTATSYTWTNDNTNIGLSASGTGDIASFSAINLGTTPEISNIEVTPIYSNNGIDCAGTPETFTITVYPRPNLEINTGLRTICSGATTNITMNSTTGGATFSWEIYSITGAITGASDGTGSLISQTLRNNTASTGSVTYQLTSYANGCEGATSNITITVHPEIDATISGDITVCQMDTEPTITFTATGGTGPYTFTYDVNGGPSQQITTTSGNSATLDAPTNSNGTFNYNLISVQGSTFCDYGVNGTATIIVDPLAYLTSTLTPPGICSNDEFNYTPISDVPGTTFTWTRAAVTGISNPADFGTDNPQENLENTTNDPIAVTYSYTLASPDGCVNIQDVVVMVTPTPILTSVLPSAPICSGEIFSYTPSSNVTSGVTYSWSRPAIAGNPMASGSGSINEVLINNTGSNIGINYTYTLSSNNCINPATLYRSNSCCAPHQK